MYLSNMSNRLKLIILTLGGLVTFFLMLKLNLMSPMWSDDYYYSFVVGTKQRVTGFNDIIRSQYQHYYDWGGRIVAHVIAQYLLMIPPLIAKMLNALVYVLYSFLMYLHIKGNSQRHSLSIFVLIFILTWLFQPAYADTIFWMTGSCNYLWCTTIVLLFLLPYRLYTGKKGSLLKCIFIFILGLLAGCSNESISPSVILILCPFFFFLKKKKYPIPNWAIVGFVGLIMGTVFLLVAPGNYVRLEKISSEDKNIPFLLLKIKLYLGALFHYVGYLIILTSMFIVLVISNLKLNKSFFVRLICIYSIGLFIPVCLMLASPIFPERALFFTVTNAVILFGLAYYNLDSNINILRRLKIVVLFLLCVIFIFDFNISYNKIRRNDNARQEREKLIAQKKVEGSKTVEISLIPADSKFVRKEYSVDLKSMSKYYGIKFIEKK